MAGADSPSGQAPAAGHIQSSSPPSSSTSINEGKPFIPTTEQFTTRGTNFFRMLTGSMSPAGQRQYWEERDRRNEAWDCNWCETKRDYFLKYSPVITFLSRHINQLGGEINKDNIYCRRCDESVGGGFDPVYGIKICANHMKGDSHLEDTIAHEMVHAYDFLRFKSDFKSNLRHAACTEIRASALSGECRFAREFFARNQWKLTMQYQECVRRRAILSVKNRPYCKDDVEAAKVVNEVWDSCFSDTRPFDEVYR